MGDKTMPFGIFTTIRFDTDLPECSSAAGKDLYMPMLHRDRLLQAAEYFTGQKTHDFSAAIELLKRNDGKDWIERVAAEARRLGMVVSEETKLGDNARRARVRVEMRPCRDDLIITAALTTAVPKQMLFPTAADLSVTPADSDIKWTVFLDASKTLQNELTSLKTSSREAYDNAHFRMQHAIKDRRDQARKEDRPQDTGLRPKTDPEIILQSESGHATEGTITSVYFHRNGRWVTPKGEFGKGPQMGTTRRWALENGVCVEEDVEMSSVVPGEIVWLSNGVRGFSPGVVV